MILSQQKRDMETQSCDTKTEPDFLDHRFPLNLMYDTENDDMFCTIYKSDFIGNRFSSFLNFFFFDKQQLRFAIVNAFPSMDSFKIILNSKNLMGNQRI